MSSYKKIFTTISLLLCIIFIFSVADCIIYYNSGIESVINNGKIRSSGIATGLESDISHIKDIADSLASGIESGEIQKGQIYDHLIKSAKYHRGLSNIGVMFKPYEFDSGVRLHSPYVIKNGGQIEKVNFDSQYDYTADSVDWYDSAIRDESTWTRPFFDELSGKKLLIYTRSFSLPGQSQSNKSGIVFAGIPVGYIEDLLSSLSIGHQFDNSYLISEDGTFLLEGQNGLHNELINTLSSSDNTSARTYTSKTTGKKMFAFLSELDLNDWSVVSLISGTSAIGDFSDYRNKTILVIVTFLLFITSLFATFISDISGNYNSFRLFWFVSVPLFLLYIAGSIIICTTALDYPVQNSVSYQSANSKSKIRNFKIQHIKQSLSDQKQPPLFIPTGIDVNSVEFITPTEVRTSGIIWQKYPKTLKKGISTDLLINNAVTQELKTAYDKELDDYRLLGWRFDAVFNPDFDYSRFPFNKNDLLLQLEHKDFYQNVVLVPDLDSYNILTPGYHPGVRSNISTSDWSVTDSFFTYDHENYITDFGFDDKSVQSMIPQLYYNINMRPNIMDIAISHFIPIGIALFIIFAIFKTAKGHYIIRPCATIFLALVYLQINMRQNLDSGEIVYIEYYYFITYFVLAGISLNTILAERSNLWIVKYKDNLIARLVFWPLTGFIILMLNTAIFYS